MSGHAVSVGGRAFLITAVLVVSKNTNELKTRAPGRFGLEVSRLGWPMGARILGHEDAGPALDLVGRRHRWLASIRRECLDHVIVLDEQHLRRILRKYVDYYHSCRTHLSLEKDAPEPRRIESPTMGKMSAIPKVGGPHHYYTRRAA